MGSLRAVKVAEGPVTRMLSPLRFMLSRHSSRAAVAAIDLGSNSFHMIVARTSNGKLHVLDRLQETVRLASGLDERGYLDKTSRLRALECLHRFGERLRGVPPDAVRAVGTDTLRRARNGTKFLAAAERALGHSIEIVSGQEEARLIYGGVVRGLPDEEAPRLIVDIGGGSTELIIGQGFDPVLAESLHMGCVSFSRRYFKDGRITGRGWQGALTAAQLELQPIEMAFRARGWKVAYGSSGTIRAIDAVLQALRLSEGGITMDALVALRDKLLAAGTLESTKLSGLNPERVPVFLGGFAILYAVFETFGIQKMDVAVGALREGLLYDLLGRIRHTSVRDRTIAAMVERYDVDVAQAERVKATAVLCFSQVASAWQLDERYEQVLAWAAQLHEIGLAIAHTKYHRHGAYLVAHSDLPGFSMQEQRLVAILIRAHRRHFPVDVFDDLPKRERRAARHLSILLRLSVLLHRARTATELPEIKTTVTRHALSLRFPRGWLTRNPLTRADLMEEVKYLKQTKIELEFS